MAMYQQRVPGRDYRLSVEQQPVRARMCGFGDKDRRPITPPPCIRLVVFDRKTGRELDFSDIDSTYFVLMVDLWDEDGRQPVNLVRHSSAAPTVSISSSTTTSYPPPPERVSYLATAGIPPQYDQQHRQAMAQQQQQQQQQQAMFPYHPPAAPTYYATPAGYPQYPTNFNPNPVQHISIPNVNSNHTRNLIGMNSVNACRLQDPEGKTGLWFVLQDLSVRTEGTFRLKLCLFDIGVGNGTNATVMHGTGPTNGKAPMLTANLTEKFTVYSAKKFPGVIESTPLSKCFAQQGIKIPIRKDAPKVSNQAEYDADD